MLYLVVKALLSGVIVMLVVPKSPSGARPSRPWSPRCRWSRFWA